MSGEKDWVDEVRTLLLAIIHSSDLGWHSSARFQRLAGQALAAIPDGKIEEQIVATWPSPDELAEFQALREYVFGQIARQLEIDSCCKSYEGHMRIWFPHYFMENTFVPEQKADNWCVQLDCYVLGPSRHYHWCGRTLGEAVDKARSEIEGWT